MCVGIIGGFMVLYLVALTCYDLLGKGFANTIGTVMAQITSEVVDFTNTYKTLSTCLFTCALIICGVFVPNI